MARFIQCRPPGTLPGVKFQKAACHGCGRPGKSQYPERYQCSVCYHEACARGCEARAVELEQRVARIRSEAKEHRRRAEAYRVRWMKKGA